MKKIDKLVLLDFLPPYFMAFFVVEFVLVMQFLWKYIDEIIGKGFSLGVLIEMIFYFSVRIIPEAVPVTILIASVMVFGNLAEKYELSSMKSAGVSLGRIMWMGLLIGIMTASFSLLASNYLKPKATYQFFHRFNAIRKQKPALNIAEGVFSKDFKDFVIRVGEKDANERGIHDIIIYDHSSNDRQLVNMLVAKDGQMYAGNDGNYFVMELEEGEQYREMRDGIDKKKKVSKENQPLIRTHFKKWTKVFDMSEFDMEAQNLNVMRKEYDLLNSFQLMDAIDSIDIKRKDNQELMNYNFHNLLTVQEFQNNVPENPQSLPTAVKEAIKKKDEQIVERSFSKSAKAVKSRTRIRAQTTSTIDSNYTSIVETFSDSDQKSLISSAKSYAIKRQEIITSKISQEKNYHQSKTRYVLRLHQQYSFALICIVFLFIGAPLGSIVKKGGYGYPLLVAIIFFMLFIILNILGERLNKSLSIDPVLAAWLPNLVIIPIAIFLTYRAVNDYGFGDIRNFFFQVFKRFRTQASKS